MRKNFTCICLCIFALSYVNGQFTKGSKLLGGTISFYTTNSANEDTRTKSAGVSFSPSYGRFYRDNRLFGVMLKASGTFRKNPDKDDSGLGAGVFFRQYRSLGKSQFSLFLEENASYNFLQHYSNQISESTLEVERRYSNYYGQLAVVPGVAYGLTRRLQLEVFVPSLVSINYYSQDWRISELQSGTVRTGKDKQFNVTTGFQQNGIGNLAVGLRWLIPA